jgi:serralysin
MRRMPNDTIIVSVATQQFVTEFGDPGLQTMGIV